MQPIRADLTTDYSNAPMNRARESAPVNGGRIAQLMLAAVGEAGDRRPVRSASFRFLAPSRYGELLVHAEALRASPSSAVYAVRAAQGETVTVVGHVDVGAAGAPPSTCADMPAVGPAAAYADPPIPPEARPYFSQRVAYRAVSSPTLFSGAERAEELLWLRLREGAIGADALAFLCDCTYATPLLAARAPMSVVTTDYQLHWCGDLAPLPPGAWVLARFALRNWQGRWATEDGAIWSADGRLLALSRQTRRTSSPAPGKADAAVA